MEEDDNESFLTHFAKYIESDVTAENLEETWQKVRNTVIMSRLYATILPVL
jgi:hypothetical protein